MGTALGLIKRDTWSDYLVNSPRHLFKSASSRARGTQAYLQGASGALARSLGLVRAPSWKQAIRRAFIRTTAPLNSGSVQLRKWGKATGDSLARSLKSTSSQLSNFGHHSASYLTRPAAWFKRGIGSFAHSISRGYGIFKAQVRHTSAKPAQVEFWFMRLSVGLQMCCFQVECATHFVPCAQHDYRTDVEQPSCIPQGFCENENGKRSWPL